MYVIRLILHLMISNRGGFLHSAVALMFLFPSNVLSMLPFCIKRSASTQMRVKVYVCTEANQRECPLLCVKKGRDRGKKVKRE